MRFYISLGKYNISDDKKDKKMNLFQLLRPDLPLIFLIISNIITIYLAIKNNWSLLTIMWIYLFQSLIIGFFNFIRILTLKEFSTEGFKINNQPTQPTNFTKYLTAFFFLFHYGLFHLVYMFFLLIGFGILNNSDNLINPFTSSTTLWILITALIFFINHLMSFIINYKKDSKKVRNIGNLMFFPYARIFPMHITIILGVFIVRSVYGLVLFMILKTIADIVMHQVEHNI